jgi:hypothetical protein
MGASDHLASIHHPIPKLGSIDGSLASNIKVVYNSET